MSKNAAFDDAAPLPEAEDLSSAEQEMFARMQAETPMPTKDEGGDPPEEEKPVVTKEAKAPEAGDDDDIDDDDVTIDGEGRARNKDGTFVESVSKSAYLRVKEARKADREALQAQQRENARLLGRFEAFEAALQGKIPGKEGAPAKKSDNPWDEPVVTDPNDAGFDLVKLLGQLASRQEYDRKQREGIQQGMQERDTAVNRVQSYVSDAKRFEKAQVDKGEVIDLEDGTKVSHFKAAYFHLVSNQDAILQALGITDKAERDRRIAQEEDNLVTQAQAAGKSPAEVLFAVAKASGWKAPAATAKAPGAQKTAAQIAAEAKLDGINKRMGQTQSLSGKGGQAASGMTGKQLLALDDAAFDAFVAQIGEEAMNKLMGAE
jgi:hypothetical protein